MARPFRDFFCAALLSTVGVCYGESLLLQDMKLSKRLGGDYRSTTLSRSTNIASTEELPVVLQQATSVKREYFSAVTKHAQNVLIGGEESTSSVISSYKHAGRERANVLMKLNGGERIVGVEGGNRAGARRISAVGSVSLKLAVESAQAYSNDIAGANAKTAADGYNASAAAGAAFLPRVEYFDKIGDEISQPSSITDASGNKVPIDKHQYRDSTWQITQPLIDVPSIYEYKRLRSAEVSSRELLNSSRERVSQDTVSAYLKLIESRLTQIITSEYERTLKKLLEWTTLRSSAGASSETDSDRVRSRVIAARAAIAENQALLETARIQFRRLTGLEPASIEIPESLLPELPPDVETALERAYSGNRDLLAAESDVEAIRYEQKGKLGRLLPKLEFLYTDRYVYNAGGIAANPASQNSFPTQRDKRALFVVSFSVFNGGSDVNQARALAEKSEEARYRAAEIRRRLEERVLINFETLLTTRDRINATREEIEVNEKVVAAFNEQLVLANRPLLDILDAVQRVNDSKLQLVRMVVAEATASYQLLSNIGSISSEFGLSE